MNLFGLNISVSRASSVPATPLATSAPPPVQKSLDPILQAFLRGDDYQPGSSSTLCNAFTPIAWVYRAATVLAEQIANIPFLFTHGDRGRENLITSGPLLDFYDQPHPYIDRFQYWELRVLWLLLRGECFRLPIWDDSPSSSDRHPRLKSILFLDPAQMRHIVQHHELAGWRYVGGGTLSPLDSQIFLPEEVWHDRLANPYDYWRGLSPLSAAELAMRTDHAGATFMRGLVENNADLGVIVRTADDLDDIQKAQIVASLRNRRNGCGNPDRPLLLSNSCEIIKPTISSADLQFIENRKFSRAEICAALGVPEEIVSTTDHNKYDVMQGARLNFIENRVAPLCARLEASEQKLIKALDPQAIGWFDLDSLPIMQQAWRTRLASAKVGFDMGIPFNELNRAFDLGFRPLPHGNNCYLPSQLQEVAHMADEPQTHARKSSNGSSFTKRAV
jgi:HK97 family phage portal protein